jgi:hypothetical protein
MTKISAGDAERLVVDPKLVLDALQLPVGQLVAAIRPLRRRIELLQLHEDSLRLRTLRADRVGMSTRHRRPE